MWIRMVTTAAGPRLPHPLIAGTVYQVEDELGDELVEILAAKEVPDPSAPAAIDAPIENASAQSEGEKAIIEDGGSKGKTLMDRLSKSKVDAAKK
jgi:hypothetical protein